MWPSLVERLLWEQEVVGSIPAIPIFGNPCSEWMCNWVRLKEWVRDILMHHTSALTTPTDLNGKRICQCNKGGLLRSIKVMLKAKTSAAYF